MQFVRAVWKLLVGIKDALVLLFMLMFFGLLYAALSARAGAGQGRRAGDRPRRQRWSSSRRAAEWSDVAGAGSVDPRISPARPRRGARQAPRTTTGSRRSRSISTASSAAAQTAIGDLGEAVDGCARGQAGRRLCHRLYRRQLPAGRGSVGNLAQPAGRGGCRRAGRNEPLLQGPARQAGRDRQRLSRRHLQVGGRALHPQRHVARGAAEYQALGDALLETWREEVTHGAAQGECRPVPDRHERRGRRGAAATSPRRRSTPGWSTSSATGATSRRGWPSSAARTTDRPAATSGSSCAPTIATGVDRSPRADRRRHHRRRDRRRQGRPRHGRRRHASPSRSKRLRNKGIKALVVRVDSPGGSVLASERIRQALLAAKAKKIPVVVSMGSVAASGGYWVSTPADFIFAEPSTITGSIGVFGILPSFEGTLAKLGVGADGVKTTPLSGEPDLLKGPSPEAGAADPGRGRVDLRALPRHRRAVAPQDAAADRPDRPGPRLGRRHRAPAGPGRRLRRDGRGGRQGRRAGQARRRARRELPRAAPSFRDQLIESAGRQRQ